MVVRCLEVVVLVMPVVDRRQFMLSAFDHGMTKGEYIFITFDLLSDGSVIDPTDHWQKFDGRDADAKKAFEAIFLVSFRPMFLFKNFF